MQLWHCWLGNAAAQDALSGGVKCLKCCAALRAACLALLSFFTMLSCRPCPSSVQYHSSASQGKAYQLAHLSCCACRYTKGPLQAASLQQWLASDVLRLPRVQPVTPWGLARFLSRTPAHKVAVLALSKGEAEPSLALRQALKLHGARVTLRRAVVAAQVGCMKWRYELCKGEVELSRWWGNDLHQIDADVQRCQLSLRAVLSAEVSAASAMVLRKGLLWDQRG